MHTRVLMRGPNTPDGIGFYHIDDNRARLAKLRDARCLTTHIENSKYKRRVVFYDRDGKAVATGWMLW